ncbi:MAG: fibronectin type III domain-containing protein [Spirochaetaceae bacterium]|nr:fibronectin type III domain-containing protein [Spirochaetaceae bacterium]
MVQNVGDTSATLKFTSNEASTYYYAVKEDSVEFGWDGLIREADAHGDVVVGENTISLTDLTAGTKYWVYLVLQDAAGNASPYVWQKDFTTTGGGSNGGGGGGDTTAPAEVSDLEATAEETSVTLIWVDPTDSDFDHIEITHNQTGGSMTKTIVKGVQTYTWEDLTANTLYTFTVKTVDVTGNKSVGMAKEATTLPPTHTLTLATLVGQNDYGTVVINTGGTGTSASALTDNSSVKVTATPGSNYSFKGWYTLENGAATQVDNANAEYTFNITADTTLYAAFTGDGSAADKPIAIMTLTDLNAIPTTGLGLNYKVFADILDTTPVTTPIAGAYTAAFTGTFDGNGHSIALNITSGDISQGTNTYAGLFARCESSAVVKNLVLSGIVNVSNSIQYVYAGAVVGLNQNSTICNVHSNVSVTVASANSGIGFLHVGGIVGVGDATNCSASGAVSVPSALMSNGSICIGGITGDGDPNYCYATGEVSMNYSGSGNSVLEVGGVTGSGSPKNCVALNSSISLSCNKIISPGRVVGTLTGSQSNNYALSTLEPSISGGSTSIWYSVTDINNKNGADITMATLTNAWFTTVSNWNTAAWAFGNNDDAPWVWVAAGQLPKLWFEDSY